MTYATLNHAQVIDLMEEDDDEPEDAEPFLEGVLPGHDHKACIASAAHGLLTHGWPLRRLPLSAELTTSQTFHCVTCIWLTSVL